MVFFCPNFRNLELCQTRQNQRGFTVVLTLDQEGAEPCLGFGNGGRVERCPLDFFATVHRFDGEPGEEFPVALPEAANRMLAVVHHLLVGIAS